MNWPAHTTLARPWRSKGRAGSRADRTLTEIMVNIPPEIGRFDYTPAGDVGRVHEDAVIAATRLEAGFGRHLAPLADFLLRSESVASSKIEHVAADWRGFAKAVAGVKASDDAKSQLAATRALASLTAAADAGPLTLAAVLDAHRLLMAPDYYTARDGGMLRTVQNWIGGSDFTPIDAMFVPPPPDLVPDLMTDLMEFANRSDLPIIAQAAIAHAQFLSIHPFTDGNGRTGRAMISAILRRRGLTRRVTVPLASVMLADTGRYFDHLTAYRQGDADGLVGYVAGATVIASEAAEVSAAALAELPERWHAVAAPRANSADEKLIAALLDTPILDATAAIGITGTSEPSTYKALDRLTEAGILEVTSTARRNRIWVAIDVMVELDSLSAAIGRRTRHSQPR
ncbi:MAG: Fic family protein [Mycobacterium sp.]|nr:Fic family protein [Mycobacterium sp.]